MLSQSTIKAMSNKNLTRQELWEFGIWVDRNNQRHYICLLSDGYLYSLLKFVKIDCIIYRYIEGELDYRHNKDLFRKEYERKINGD